MTISCRVNSSTVLDDNIWTLGRRSWLLRQSSAIEIRRQGSENMTTQKRVTQKKRSYEFEFYDFCRQIMTISCRINSSTVLDMNIWTLRRRSRLLRQSSAIEIRRQGSLNMTTQKRVTEKKRSYNSNFTTFVVKL